MKKTAEEIAAQLSQLTAENWQAETYEEDYWLSLKGPDNYQIDMRRYREGSQTRYRFSGRYPPHPDGSASSGAHMWDDPPKITTSAERSPLSIAKDIQRRLLPEYKRVYAVVIERHAAWTENQAQINRIAQHLADILSVTVNLQFGPERPRLYTYQGPGRGKFEILSRELVSIEINTDPLTARRIAMIIADQ
jgi:hypothetical protein